MYFQKNDFNYMYTEHFEQVATRLVNSFKIFLSMNTCYKQVYVVFSSGEVMATQDESTVYNCTTTIQLLV